MRIVVDANVILAQALELDYSPPARSRFADWVRLQAPIFAPTLWRYEVASALRKFVASGNLSESTANTIVTRMFELGISDVAPSIELQERTLHWSAVLCATVAYDAAYLAVAERLGADLWTADRTLAQEATAACAGWVHHVGEAR